VKLKPAYPAPPPALPPWTLIDAVKVATELERIAPLHGAHVALTGGCLYKTGPRKDLDILFYRIRQVKEIDESGLLAALEDRGFELGSRYGWVQKATYDGKPVDLFFPESKNNDKFPMRPGDKRPANYFDAPDLSNVDLV
jgi:hypothetical protein